MHYRILMIFLSLSYFYGCASLHQYPPVEKKLFSWQIPKTEVETIKHTILSNGYKITTRDNYKSCVNYSSFTDCVIISQYGKEVLTPTNNTKVHIRLTFKETDPPSDFYRNLSITIVNLDRNNIPEINDEVNRIEGILYKKLLEVAGEKNVIRGERK